MAKQLTITNAFLSYHKGDVVTDLGTIASIEANPDYSGFYVQTDTPSSGNSSPVATPTVLVSNRGSVIPDNTYLSISSTGVLSFTPQVGSSSNLGYTPADAAKIGAVNGIASLDSGGRLPINQLTAGVVGAVNYVGLWNANTNSPSLASGIGSKGQYYKVSVAGSTPIDGNTVWSIGDLLIFNGTSWDRVSSGINSPVVSFNQRVGNVVLSASDVQFALGFAPYSSANPNSYVTTSNLSSLAPVRSFNNRTGAISLTISDVTNALGYTPYDVANPNNYVAQSQLSNYAVTKFNNRMGVVVLGKSDVTTALGYSPYDSANPAGYINLSQIPQMNASISEIGIDFVLGTAAIGATVSSVAGMTGNVTLTAANIGGLANVATSGSFNDLTNKPIIPSNTSQLSNNSGFITASTAPVKSVNTQTGDIVLSLSQLANDTSFITAVQAPVQSVQGMTGAVTLPTTSGSLVAAALSSLTNDLGYLTGSSDVSTALVVVNGVTNTLAQWISRFIRTNIIYVLNRSGGFILARNGAKLGV